MPATVLTYNGVAIDVMRVLKCDRKVVYNEDNTQPLYVHHHLVVQGAVHPQATAVNRGDLLATSLVSLKDALWQPRKRLVLQVGGLAVIDSPRLIPGKNTRFTCDCKNGPLPGAVDIVEFMGEKSAIIVFEVETWTNACTTYPKSVLSHRWEMSHEIDIHHLTTRTVTGRVTFSAEMLNDPLRNTGGFPIMPDDFRSTYLQPIPTGTQRTKIFVKQLGDGLSVDYHVEDEEQTLNLQDFDAGRGITKIEAFHRSGHDTTGEALMPTRYVSIVVRAWGRRTTTRQQLVAALVNAAATYNFHRPFNAGWWESSDLDVDLVNKFAELRMAVRLAAAGPFDIGGQLFVGGGNAPNSAFNTGLFGRNNYVESLANWANITPARTIRPPNDLGARGTFLERIVAQNLYGQCDFPTPPPANIGVFPSGNARDGRAWTGGANGTET